MFKRLRAFAFVLLAAVAGAVVGRIALDAREKAERGESLTMADLRRVTLRMQDVVPGIVAAFRVKDAPWSWFHIPSWLAAFGVNASVAAMGGDIASLREQAERTAFGLVGLDARDFGFGGDPDEDSYAAMDTSEWEGETPPPTGFPT